MNSLLVSSLAMLAGCIGLIWSADRFVAGAATTARALGVSPLVIGLTIVALGTSAPEIFTSAAAALAGSPEIAIGNVVGSNIANICLILGLTLLIRPVLIPVALMKYEIPALVLVTVLAWLLMMDGDLDRLDGYFLLLLLGLFLWRTFRETRVQKASTITDEGEIAEFLTTLPPGRAVMLMLFALALMVVSSEALVWGARNIALGLGISELVVGLTVVAIGTSLPELATSVTSALKGHHELAIGNIVGSNILNILVVLPFPALLAHAAVNPLVISRDAPVMIGVTLVLAGLLFHRAAGDRTLGRNSGMVFIIFYLAYTAALILSSSSP